MKKTLIIALLCSTTMIAVAQQPFVISIGGGINNPSSDLKNQHYMGNGYNLQADLMIPLIGKQDHQFTLGLLATGNYNPTKNLPINVEKLQATYKLYNGTLDMTNVRNGGALTQGFTGTLGLQANFKLGLFTLSPSVNGGYFSYHQNGSAQRSTVLDNNGNLQTITLFELPEVKKTGFILRPQTKVSYSVSSALSIYTSAALNIGPETNLNQKILKPAGGFNDKNTYEPSQLSSGKMIDLPASAHYQTLMVNFGLSWNLTRSSKRLKGKVIKTGDNGMVKRQNPLYDSNGTSGENPMSGSSAMAKPGSPIGGIVVKGGKNPGGNSLNLITSENGEVTFPVTEIGEYTLQIFAPDMQEKSINEKEVKASKRVEVLKSNKTGDQPMAISSVGTKSKGSGATSSSYARVASAGNPIGGIIVKGGKNPGGNSINLVTDEDGKVTFTAAELGDYTLQIITPETSGKSISEQGVKANPPKKNESKGRTYTGGRKSEVSGQNMLLAPGSPIGGIVVKGGKNPGGNSLNLITNENGEVTFPVTEIGEYTLQIFAPDTEEKSINEKGVRASKRVEVLKSNKAGGQPAAVSSIGTKSKGSGATSSSYARVASPGNPIGGIIVKGGKNPGGSSINLITNENGKVTFKVTEIGDYTLQIITTEHSGKSINE